MLKSMTDFASDPLGLQLAHQPWEALDPSRCVGGRFWGSVRMSAMIATEASPRPRSAQKAEHPMRTKSIKLYSGSCSPPSAKCVVS